MADPATIADILRLALLTNDEDTVRKMFPNHRDLIMRAAHGGLGEMYQEKARPVLIKLLEEEQAQQQAQQPPELPPALAVVPENTQQAAAGLRVHRQPASPIPLQPSVVSSTIGADKRGPTPAEISHGQVGREDAARGAAQTGQSAIVFGGGREALPPLDQNDGDAEAALEGSSPPPRPPSSVRTTQPAEDDASVSEHQPCASCLRAGVVCVESPLMADEPGICLRCSLRGTVCRPPPGTAHTQSGSISASQELQRPSAAAGEPAEGSQDDLRTLLEVLRRLNPLMAQAIQVGDTMSKLNAAVRGAIQTADHALASGALGRRPGISQAPSANAATETAPSPSVPSSARRPTPGDSQGQSMGRKGS
ncbi:hypothetical protein EV715DRAFT_296984 [Schizophyllum commune]